MDQKTYDKERRHSWIKLGMNTEEKKTVELLNDLVEKQGRALKEADKLIDECMQTIKLLEEKIRVLEGERD